MLSAESPESRSTPAPKPDTEVTLQQVRDAWPEILDVVEKAKRSAWMVVYTSNARALSGDVLTLSFPSESDVASFRQAPGSGDNVSEHLRAAISDVLGIRVKFIARVEAPVGRGCARRGSDKRVAGRRSRPGRPRQTTMPHPRRANPRQTRSWARRRPRMPSLRHPQISLRRQHPKSPPPLPAAPATPGRARYGEAVVREILGANFIEETELAPRDRPVTLDPARGEA